MKVNHTKEKKHGLGNNLHLFRDWDLCFLPVYCWSKGTDRSFKALKTCRGGEIGKRTGFKIQRELSPLRVRVPPSAL